MSPAVLLSIVLMVSGERVILTEEFTGNPDYRMSACLERLANTHEAFRYNWDNITYEAGMCVVRPPDIN